MLMPKKGGVRFIRGKEVILYITEKGGYHKAKLFKNGKEKGFLVHRLVAEAFIPNPENKPCIDHINTNPQNNNITNLRWVTHKENSNNPLTREHISKSKKGCNHTEGWKREMSERFRGEKHPRAKAVYCYEKNEIRLTAKEWSEELGISAGNICKCCKGKRKSTGGYHFRYATEEVEEYKNKLAS